MALRLHDDVVVVLAALVVAALMVGTVATGHRHPAPPDGGTVTHPPVTSMPSGLLGGHRSPRP